MDRRTETMTNRIARARERAEQSGRNDPPRRFDVRAMLRRDRLPLIYLVALLVLSLVLFPPGQKQKGVRFAEGDVADVDIVASFTFSVPLPDHEVELARAKAAIEIPPVFVREEGAAKHLPGDLRNLFERIEEIASAELSVRERVSRIKTAAPELRKESVELLVDGSIRSRMLAETARLQKNLLQRGIVNDGAPLRRRAYERVTVISGGDETLVPASGLVDQGDLESLVMAEGRKVFPQNEKASRLFHTILRSNLTANLVFDVAETRKRRDEATKAVDRSFTVSRGTRVVAKHDRVTARQVAMLQAMEQKRMARELATSIGGRIWLGFGKGLRIAALLALLALALRRFEPRIVAQQDRLTLAFIVIVLYLVLTAVVMRIAPLDPRLIPTAFVALVSTAFFGVHAAVLLTLFASFLIVVNTSLPAGYAFTALLAGAAGIISIAHLRDRRSFYTVFFSVSAAYVVGIAGFGITDGLAPAAFAREAAFGVANALACTIMVMFLQPVFESLFDVTTNFTLMELSDLNRPLLRRLIMEAPGTYHHSLMVGNLVETVAREVRANGLEARVGAYYHDIGKLSKPEYFFENTGERENKHENLAPRMSAIILVAHVKEGVELARNEKLPRIIVDAISEHHGRTVMAYFYQKALEYDSNDSVNADDFRYPGPRPRSKETALIMLADSCEAAVRSLRDPTVPKIRAIVQKIIEMRTADGELDESGLTLNDIAVIREKFIQLLTSVIHPRIAYPMQREERAGANGGRTP
jgi:hypothetical protein